MAPTMNAPSASHPSGPNELSARTQLPNKADATQLPEKIAMARVRDASSTPC